MNHALNLEEVSKVYGRDDNEVRALDRTSLQVAQDEIVALVGPSGSGKTTLCTISGGILSPEGRVIVGGEDITGFSRKQLTEFRRRKVGFVFQTVSLVPFLTARRICWWSANSGRPAPAARSCASAPTSCSRSWDWPSGRATCPASSPAASSSGWPSAGR